MDVPRPFIAPLAVPRGTLEQHAEVDAGCFLTVATLYGFQAWNITLGKGDPTCQISAVFYNVQGLGAVLPSAVPLSL